ncbi:TPA: aldehyde dehydrogenase family protein, partial [Acinetobacter baumannii]
MPFLDQTLWNKKVFNGQWLDSSRSYDVIDKGSSEVLGQIGYADANSILESSVIAKKMQGTWWQKTYLERQNIFENAVKVAQEYQNEIIDWLMKESGSLRMKAAFETQITIQILKNCISLPASNQGQVLPSTNGKISLAKRVPLGVVGVISPFNFPLYLAMRAVAPALALGNAVILKPDERTAICGGMIIARIFELAGLPEGLLHVLPGGADVGEAITLDKNIASIQFTGSTAVGRIIAENAAKNLKKVSLELGGKNSLIILDDADIEIAVANIAWGVFLHSGQICMTSGKILIHESIYQKVKNR